MYVDVVVEGEPVNNKNNNNKSKTKWKKWMKWMMLVGGLTLLAVAVIRYYIENDGDENDNDENEKKNDNDGSNDGSSSTCIIKTYINNGTHNITHCTPQRCAPGCNNYEAPEDPTTTTTITTCHINVRNNKATCDPEGCAEECKVTELNEVVNEDDVVNEEVPHAIFTHTQTNGVSINSEHTTVQTTTITRSQSI